MKKALIIILLILNFSNIFAQLDTIAKQDEAMLLMKKADSIRLADSLKKEVVKKQLEELAKNEINKRKQLEKQLKQLNIADSLNRVAMKNEIDSLKRIAKGYPITPYKDTIFYIFTRIGQITAAERAAITNERLKYLYNRYIIKYDSLNIINYGQSVDVIYKDKTIISITEYDATWFGKSKNEIANNYKSIIYNDLIRYKENTSLLTILKQIGLVLLAIVVQILLIRLVNIFFKRKIDKFIIKQKDIKIKGIKIKDYQFLDSQREIDVFLFISKSIRWFINLLQLYLTVPVLFSIFPPTQRLAETLFGYVLMPLEKIGIAVINYLPNLFAIIVIVIITRYVIKFLRFVATEIATEKLKITGFYPDWAQPTFNIVRFLILAFMFVVIFPYLPGSNSPVFQGVSVFLGIMFTLGSSSVIGNMIAGIVMTYMRPFKIGDRIKIGEIVGTVVEKTPFVTRLRTPKKEFITIPNSSILSSNVLNYNTKAKAEGLILHTTVTIGYDMPWRDVHKALIDAALKTDKVVHDPSPFVLQTSLDDFYVSYQLNVFTYETRRYSHIYSNLHQNIQDIFNERGIEIMSPHYRAQRDGNTTTIPANYWADDYEVPKFNINIDNKK